MKSLDFNDMQILSSPVENNARHVLQLPKFLYFNHILQIEQQCRELFQANCEVVIDLGRMQELDSAGIGCLLQTKQSVDERGGTFRLVNIPSNIFEQNRSCLEYHFQCATAG